MPLFRVAILDQDKNYLMQLGQYMRTHSQNHIAFDFYDSAQELPAEQELNQYQGLLVCEAEIEQVECLQTRIAILLFGGQEDRGSHPNLPFIDKYQSISQVIGSILEQVCGGDQPQRAANSNPAKLYGVYPLHQFAGANLLGLQLALKLGEDSKVLYLPLTQLSGLRSLLSKEHKKNLSDILASCGEKQGNVMMNTLHAAILPYESIDLIEPVSDPLHLSEITAREWNWFFEELRRRSGHDIIVIEFDFISAGIENEMPLFERLYYTDRSSPIQAARKAEFLKLAETWTARSKGIEFIPVTVTDQVEKTFSSMPLERIYYNGMSEYLNPLVGGKHVDNRE